MASWCTLPHDGCTRKFKLHVFYELHAVSPALYIYIYCILLLAMKQAYCILYGDKIPHKTNYSKGFLCSLGLLHNAFFFFFSPNHCHTPYFPILFPSFLLWSRDLLFKTFWSLPFLDCFYELDVLELFFLTMKEHTDEGL